MENFSAYSASPCKWPKFVDHRLKQGFFLLRLSVEVRIEKSRLGCGNKLTLKSPLTSCSHKCQRALAILQGNVSEKQAAVIFVILLF